VTTGFVTRKKLGFLQHAASVEREFSVEGSPAPSSTGRGLRVTWADSPGGSRPDSRLQDIDTLRAQTPPLAGEWATDRGATNTMVMQSHQEGGNNGIMMQQQQMGSAQFSSSSSTFQASKSTAFSSSKQMSSSSSFSSSSQKTSFSQSASSSFQSTGIEASKAFEAFPGMNTIDNLKLEQ